MGLTLDQARDVATCNAKYRDQFFMPVAKFAWLAPVESFKPFDGVGQVSALVVGEVLLGGRK